MMKLSLSLAVLVLVLAVGVLSPTGSGSAAGAAATNTVTAAGLPQGVPAGSVELPGLRTRTSRTYATPDGAFEAMISPGPLNYRDGSGAWQQIDNSLVASAGGGYENAGNSFKTYVPSDAGGEVKVASDGASVSLHLLGASGAGSVSGATISYKNALPGVDVSYEAEPDALKESLTLASAAAASSFSYSLTTSGVTPQKNGAGGVDLVDQYGKALLHLAAPVMQDAAGHVSSAFTVALAPSAGGYTLTVTPDTSWLASPSRTWPVKVDPTINAADDCSIESASPTTSFCGASRLYVGWDGSHADRAVLSYDTSSIPSNVNVFAAKLQANLIQQSATSPTSISLYQLTRAYTGSVTWNSYDGTHAWTSAGGDFGATPISTTSGIGSGQAAGVDLSPTIPYYWALTTLVRGWVYGTIANDGVLLKQTSESTNNVQQFDRSGSGEPLLVTYRPRVGLRDEYSYDSQQLNDRMGINVNVANGNLVFAANDLTLNEGAGPSLSLTRYYNSALMSDSAHRGVFGTGWSMAPADIKLLFSNVNTGSGWDDSTVTFQDGDMSTYVFTKNSDGSYSAPPSINANLVKNGDSSYTLTFHPSGLKYNFPAYNGLDVGLSSIVDRNGNTDTFNYSGGRLTGITTPRGSIGFSYGSNGLVSSISDGLGRTWQYGYDSNNELTSYTDPNGKVTSYGYLGLNMLTSITEPVSNVNAVATINYGSNANVTSILDGPNVAPQPPSRSFTYNSGNTVVTDENGHATIYYYDSLGRVTKVTDPLGHSQQTAFNSNGDVSSETNATNAVTTYGYDSKFNPTSMQLPTGVVDSLAYADSANPYLATKQTDGQGNSWNYGYDGNGNLTQKSEGATGQNPLKFAYNSNGTLRAALDAKGTQTAACAVDPTLGVRPTYCYSYDSLGDLTQITYPSPLGAELFNYDAMGRVKTTTDGAGNTATYTYDNLDRVTNVSYSGGSSIGYVYDGNGNLTSMTDNTGTTNYTYDSQNQLTQESLPGGKTMSYGYDPAGNLNGYTDAGGIVSYGYDAADRVTSLTEPNHNVTSFGYDQNDNRTSTSYPNGVAITYGYDASERLTSISAKKGASTLTSYTYSYSQAGTDRELIQSVTDNVAAQTTSYTYDTLERLLRANSTSANYQYAYDVNGNMCAKNTGSYVSGFSCSSSGSGVTTFSYNTANELTAVNGGGSYSFDGAGNETASPSFSSLAYNAKNQTTSITPSGGSAVNMTYSGQGQADRTAVAGTSQVNSSLLGLTAETTGANTTYYAREPDGSLTEERLPSGNYYYLYDGLGSAVALTDSNGNVVDTYKYDPYGNITSSTGTVANPWKFAGLYFDSATGLYKAGERYYAPGAGRWLQRDPIDSPLDISGWNRYLYAGDNPVNNTDTCGTVTSPGPGGGGPTKEECQEIIRYLNGILGTRHTRDKSRLAKWHREYQRYKKILSQCRKDYGLKPMRPTVRNAVPANPCVVSVGGVCLLHLDDIVIS